MTTQQFRFVDPFRPFPVVRFHKKPEPQQNCFVVQEWRDDYDAKGAAGYNLMNFFNSSKYLNTFTLLQRKQQEDPAQFLNCLAEDQISAG
jgi:hypothetical protein